MEERLSHLMGWKELGRKGMSGKKTNLKMGRRKKILKFPSRSIHKLKNFQTIAVIFKAEEFPPL